MITVAQIMQLTGTRHRSTIYHNALKYGWQRTQDWKGYESDIGHPSPAEYIRISQANRLRYGHTVGRKISN